MEKDWSQTPVSPSGDGWFGHYGHFEAKRGAGSPMLLWDFYPLVKMYRRTCNVCLQMKVYVGWCFYYLKPLGHVFFCRNWVFWRDHLQEDDFRRSLQFSDGVSNLLCLFDQNEKNMEKEFHYVSKKKLQKPKAWATGLTAWAMLLEALPTLRRSCRSGARRYVSWKERQLVFFFCKVIRLCLAAKGFSIGFC